MKKLVVTNVTTQVVPDHLDKLHYTRLEDIPPLMSDGEHGIDPLMRYGQSISVPIRKFNIDGTEYWIGWTPEVEQAIGIPLSIIEKMSNDIQQVQQSNRKYFDRLQNLLYANLWTRIKWVWKGVFEDE